MECYEFGVRKRYDKNYRLDSAQANSKGVPGKNIRNFGGHPLIVVSRSGHKIIRSTGLLSQPNSAEYAEVARSYGGEVPFMRPDEISNDSSTDIEFVQHAIRSLAERDEKPELLASSANLTSSRTKDN